MDKIKLVEAWQLKPGDIITWNSGFYDYVDKVEIIDNNIAVYQDGVLKASMIFERNYVLRIVNRNRWRK